MLTSKLFLAQTSSRSLTFSISKRVFIAVYDICNKYIYIYVCVCVCVCSALLSNRHLIPLVIVISVILSAAGMTQRLRNKGFPSVVAPARSAPREDVRKKGDGNVEHRSLRKEHHYERLVGNRYPLSRLSIKCCIVLDGASLTLVMKASSICQ